MAEIPGDLVSLGVVHNFDDYRDLLLPLIDVRYKSGALSLWLDSVPRPSVLPCTRTLLWVGGDTHEEEECGYYCDVIAEPGPRKRVLISKADLDRLASEARAVQEQCNTVAAVDAAETVAKEAADSSGEVCTNKPAAVGMASFAAVRAAVEKRGPAVEAELLRAVKQELAPKRVSRQQVRDARDGLFGKPGRIGRPKGVKKSCTQKAL